MFYNFGLEVLGFDTMKSGKSSIVCNEIIKQDSGSCLCSLVLSEVVGYYQNTLITTLRHFQLQVAYTHRSIGALAVMLTNSATETGLIFCRTYLPQLRTLLSMSAAIPSQEDLVLTSEESLSRP